MNQHLIPTLDLWDYISPQSINKNKFVEDVRKALTTTGFFFLKNHGISQSTLKQARTVFDDFFLKLNDAQRLKYEYRREKHQRGYTPPRLEKGEYSKIPDEKHFFQIGRDRNVTVPGIKGFNDNTNQLFNEFRTCALALLDAISESMGLLPEQSLSHLEGNSIMRAIDYPPTANPLRDDGPATLGGNITGMCATKHTDINLITLLDAHEEGLELWYDNQWIPITITDPNVIIVNAGDMLQHLTNGVYVSGLHRVVCKPDVRRFAIPYFCHPRPNVSISPLRQFGKPNREKFPFRKAGRFLNHRLKQIGL